MSQFTPEQNKINTNIAKRLDISIGEVDKAIDLYWKGIASKIRIDEPCEIIIPYLGKLIPSKTYLKEVLARTNEVSNTQE